MAAGDGEPAGRLHQHAAPATTTAPDSCASGWTCCVTTEADVATALAVVSMVTLMAKNGGEEETWRLQQFGCVSMFGPESVNV